MSTAIWLLAIVSASLSSALHAGETISFCPGPDERYRSPLYEVRSTDGEPAFVYCRENGWKQVPDTEGGTWPLPVMSADNHWVGLSAEHPGYSFVRINGGHGDKHPLFIFADPPEKDVPAKGPSVHFFGPGVHDIGPHYAVKTGETVYIAPGAVVRGTITARGANVRICGRGVLSGELMQDEWMRHKRGLVAKPQDARGAWGIAPMVWNEEHGGSTTVEGITVIDAPSYNLMFFGTFAVRNVKLLSWNYSTDGMGGGAGVVEQCFCKVNDDVFTLYYSGRMIRNVVIWKQMNQAVFQLGSGG